MMQFDRWKWLLLSACLWGATGMGCTEAPPNGSVGHSAQQALIGKTKQELFDCAGIPVSEKTIGDQTVIIYYKEASPLEESFPGSKSSFAKVHHGCRATLFLRQDRVSEVRYESVPSAYEDEDHCVEIFERCPSP